MKHYPPDPGMDHILDVLNLIFTGVFALEALFKIIALNPKNYFGDRFVFFLGASLWSYYWYLFLLVFELWIGLSKFCWGVIFQDRFIYCNNWIVGKTFRIVWFFSGQFSVYSNFFDFIYSSTEDLLKIQNLKSEWCCQFIFVEINISFVIYNIIEQIFGNRGDYFLVQWL